MTRHLVYIAPPVSPSVAGALIYLKSTGRRVSDFCASQDAALADIQRCAVMEKTTVCALEDV